MFAVFTAARKVTGRIVLVLSFLWLAACQVGTGGPVINTAKPVPVALLVPGGTDKADVEALALSLTNAARLAIGDLDGVKIDLRVYNTAADADIAAKMASKAVNEGAKIILGPVFAANANAAGVAVRGRNVNVLAFSNNPSIAGGNVFILGNTYQNTANRLVDYALRQGKQNILIVHGRDLNESTGRDAIQRAIASRGATLAGINAFELSVNGIVEAMPDIREAVRTSGAQAVFLTSGTDGALMTLAGEMQNNSVTAENYQYIGLTRWDIPVDAVQNRYLQNGWYAVPDEGLSGQFRARFESAYGKPPHPIAGLAYDGIAAIGALVKAGKSDALTVDALTQAQGFVGVNGVFRLRADGTNERAMAIAVNQDGQKVILEPAPKSFGGAGS